MGSYNHQEAKFSLHPQIEKQLTMGRTTQSLTLLTPFPWSCHMAPSSIIQCWLGGKSRLSVLPETHARNQVPGLPLPKGWFPPCLQPPCCTTFLEPIGLLLPKGLIPPHLQQLLWLQVALHQQASLRALTVCKLGSLLPAAAAVTPGSPLPNTRRPQSICCLVDTKQLKLTGFAAPWVPSICFSVPGTCHQTSKWTPGSGLCYSAGAKRLPSP
jgi:hypothetical protein